MVYCTTFLRAFSKTFAMNIGEDELSGVLRFLRFAEICRSGAVSRRWRKVSVLTLEVTTRRLCFAFEKIRDIEHVCMCLFYRSRIYFLLLLHILQDFHKAIWRKKIIWGPSNTFLSTQQTAVAHRFSHQCKSWVSYFLISCIHKVRFAIF